MIYLVAILLPPLALILRKQYNDLPINIVLWVLGWLHGVIHACIVIAMDIRLKRTREYRIMMEDVQKQADQIKQKQAEQIK